MAIKKLEIDMLNTGKHFHNLRGSRSYSVYIHGHLHNRIALKYMEYLK
jgi:hypothetical protein